MRIVFIGAGNLATNLAKELYSKKFEIVQVFSRTMKSANALAQKVNATPTSDISQVITDADLYIFSVKDSVLADLISNIPQTSGIWAHTAGSMPMSIFQSYHSDYGVIYPFQTFSKNKQVDFQEIPVFVEANNESSLEILKDCISHFSAKVFPLSSEKRKYIHLCGVFACNFVNHLYAISEDILEKENIPFEVLQPLIDETARKVHKLSPKEAQTGPAMRYDENVINKHLSLLKDENQRSIYELLSKNIHKTHQQK